MEGQDRHEDTCLPYSCLLTQEGEKRLSAFGGDQIGSPADRTTMVAA
jgi:hypothetical protein